MPSIYYDLREIQNYDVVTKAGGPFGAWKIIIAFSLIEYVKISLI